ncbi:MAG: NADP-dependent oxidoreductase [Proteobacteria bacterium]|nr:NADP-dependent oxidoreductase [Pseudomonadota bacterium]
MKSREIHLKTRPDGLPKTSDFELVETDVHSPERGQVLVKNLYMSVDPAMRPPLTNGRTKLNEAMPGGAIGKIVESKNDSFSVGDHVLSRNGFRELYLSDGSNLERIDLMGEPLTTHLHVLGITGLTAWGGLLIIGKAKEGETVFVSAAAGAVGSTVGQIAKIKGCRVIGSCGSDDKKDILLNELGFDYAFNYKDANIRKELQKGAPEGIDVYFDNVGGDHLDAALTVMKPRGRIPVCGMISAYNNRGARSTGVTTLSNIIYSQVTLRGFVATEFLPRRDRFLMEARQWLAQGKLKYRETILNGIEKAPEALIGLFTGLNTGKMLVCISKK